MTPLLAYHRATRVPLEVMGLTAIDPDTISTAGKCIEALPNWPAFFQVLKNLLGYRRNGPFGWPTSHNTKRVRNFRTPLTTATIHFLVSVAAKLTLSATAHALGRDSPLPTCVNCGGVHTADSAAGPVFKQENWNRKAGTNARTYTSPPKKSTTVEELLKYISFFLNCRDSRSPCF